MNKQFPNERTQMANRDIEKNVQRKAHFLNQDALSSHSNWQGFFKMMILRVSEDMGEALVFDAAD